MTVVSPSLLPLCRSNELQLSVMLLRLLTKKSVIVHAARTGMANRACACTCACTGHVCRAYAPRVRTPPAREKVAVATALALPPHDQVIDCPEEGRVQCHGRRYHDRDELDLRVRPERPLDPHREPAFW